MRRAMLNLLAVTALVYIALCALLFLMQRSLIYFPQPGPADSEASSWRLRVDGADLLINRRPFDGADAVLYFGGNAESVAYSLPDLAVAFPKHALFALNYRGYGGSSGSPSQQALFADAVALFDRVRAEHPRIVVVGRSLGSGVAVYLASVRKAERLVLVTPYESIQTIAEQQFPFFPVRWLLQDKYESWRYAGRIDTPTLILVADNDEVIPRRSSEALAARFKQGIASLRVLAGTGHNTISGSADYAALLGGADTAGR